MAYLILQDLYPNIRDRTVKQLIDDDDAVFEAAAIQAEALLFNYLHRYDISKIIAQKGTERNQALIHYIKTITLYFLYERACDDQVPDRVVKDYDDTIIALNKIAKGTMIMHEVPKEENEDGTVDTSFDWGGEGKRNNTF